MEKVIAKVESKSRIGLGWYWNLFQVSDGIACECPAFTLLGTCKHILQYQNQSNSNSYNIYQFRKKKYCEYQGIRKYRKNLSKIPIREYGIELEGGVKCRQKLQDSLRKKNIDTKITYLYNGGRLADHIVIGWDGSISGIESYIIEITTPKLIGWGSKRYGFRVVKEILNSWTRVGAEVNETCGLHVTVDTSDFTILDYQRLAIFFFLSQCFIFPLVEESRWDNEYCKPVYAYEALNLEEYAETRYKAMNIVKAWRQDENQCVEFRIFHGTYKKIEVESYTVLSLCLIDSVKNKWKKICKFFETIDYRESPEKQFKKWLSLIGIDTKHPVKKRVRKFLIRQFELNYWDYVDFLRFYYRRSLLDAFRSILYEEDGEITLQRLFGEKSWMKIKKNITS